MKRTVILFIILSFIQFNDIFSQQLAFPCVKGAGSYVTGGRGGRILKVTNLNDTGPGSLRAALLDTGKRIIVFEVSGTIVWNDKVELILENSDFTIAGQTAPEGGITISNNYLRIGGGWSRPSQPCNNIIIRYIRFRNGRYTGVPDVAEHNGIISTGCDGLVLDHCSFSFCDDQALAMGGDYGDFTNITVQNCTFSENATGIIAGLNPTYPTGKMTFIENLFVDQSHRTPNVGGNLQYDIVNNVFFNWGSRLSNVNSSNPEINFLNNYLKPGSYTTTGGANKVQIVNASVTPSIYTANNYHPTYYPSPTLNDQNLWQDFYTNNPVSSTYFVTTQFPLLGHLPYGISSAQQAYNDVLSNVGANKYLNPNGTYGNYQDSFDSLKIYNVLNNISSDPFNKSWTLPTLPLNTRPAGYDTNNDGIADAWAAANIPLGKTANDTAPNGYTWIEEFLNKVDACNNTTPVSKLEQEEFSIYPNPAKNKFIVKSTKGSLLKIIDVNGKVIFESDYISGNEINIESITNGLYVINFFDNNQIIGSKKLNINK